MTPIVRVQTGDMRKVPMTDGSSEKVPLTLLGLAKKFTSMKLGSLPYTHTNMEDGGRCHRNSRSLYPIMSCPKTGNLRGDSERKSE